MDYGLAINIINIVGASIAVLMLCFSWYYVVALFTSGKKVKPVPHSDKKTKFAVIIPARNEARVIKHILTSLKQQTYNKKYFDVWVIVESKQDPTTIIVKAYGYNCFVRKKLENRHTKGFAIQELHEYLKENNYKYDAYMIFDADNMLSRRYLEIMNDLRQTGVQVGLGYRNFTNASRNWLTCTSATFFCYMMTFTARMRTVLFKKSTICGTGFFVNTDIIDSAGGWIFTGMTEDTQFTTYCYYHDVNMCYYPLVEYYDEMCGTFKDSHNQKLRWIWGYFEDRKPFKEVGEHYHNISDRRMFWAKLEYKVAIFPFAIFTIVNFILFLISFGLSITSMFANISYWGTLIGLSFVQLAILWGTYIIIAAAVIIKDNKRLRFNFPTIIWTLFTYIFFFGDILLCVFDGLFDKTKRSNWKAIDHTGDLTNKDAKGINKNE